jgi:hypothetical protein
VPSASSAAVSGSAIGRISGFCAEPTSAPNPDDDSPNTFVAGSSSWLRPLATTQSEVGAPTQSS